MTMSAVSTSQIVARIPPMAAPKGKGPTAEAACR